MMAILLLIAALQTGTSHVNAAESTTSFEAMLEALSDTEEDAESVYESLEDAARWRIPINTASSEALRGLPGLSARELQQLLSYRAARGLISGPEDLLAAGLSEETMTTLLPFVTFETSQAPSITALRGDFIQRLSRRLDLGRGYRSSAPTRYLGSPVAVQSRIRFQFGRRVSAGMTIDKDAGEPLWWSPRQSRFGADFASLHLGVDEVGPVERLVVGGYSVHTGEGLILGHGTSGMSALKVASVERLLRTHTSSREHGYFRGLALQSRPVFGASFAAFASTQALDGRRDAPQGSWRLAAPGPHRTATEQDGRRLIPARVGGGVVTMRRGSLHVGALAVHTRYGLETAHGRISSVSLFGGWIRPQWAVTTEVVPDLAHGSATASYSPSSDAALTIRIRRTSSGSARPHSRIGVDSRGASIEMTEWQAEYGFRPLAAWSTTIHVRERRRPGDHFLPEASRHADVFLEYKPRSWFILHLRGTARTSKEAAACAAGRRLLRCSARHARRSLRLQAEYRHSASLRSRSRLELVHAAANGHPDDGAEAGLLLYEDVRWRVGRFLQLDVRYAVFETSSASARVYALENDVLYAFSAPSFSGRGRRWYVLARADPSLRLSVQFKIGFTVYEDVARIGTGLDEVSGNRMRELKLQMRWKVGR